MEAKFDVFKHSYRIIFRNARISNISQEETFAKCPEALQMRKLFCESYFKSSRQRCSVKKNFSEIFRKFHWKTPVLESLFNKVAR